MGEDDYGQKEQAEVGEKESRLDVGLVVLQDVMLPRIPLVVGESVQVDEWMPLLTHDELVIRDLANPKLWERTFSRVTKQLTEWHWSLVIFYILKILQKYTHPLSNQPIRLRYRGPSELRGMNKEDVNLMLLTNDDGRRGGQPGSRSSPRIHLQA